MRITNEPPPYHIAKTAFDLWGAEFNKGIVFTYGDTIHARKGADNDLLVHELIHVRQQREFEGGKDEWWKKYFFDAKFRLEQELEAYFAQVLWIRENIKDRELKFKMIRAIAKDISGNMYGNVISYDEAMKIIK